MVQHEITKLVEEMGGWDCVSDDFIAQASKVLELEKQMNFEMDILKLMTGNYKDTMLGVIHR